MSKLSNLRNHIYSSNTDNDSSSIILAEEIIKLTGMNVDFIIGLTKKLIKLPIKKEITLNILDFDETLYSRFNQLQDSLFQNNRGIDGNKIINQIGIDNFVKKFYKRSGSTIELLKIIENQNQNHKSIILTAGETNLQINKCKKIGLDYNKVKIIVVKEGKNKPMKMIQEILELGYIPGKIIVYEDRPEFFLGNNGKILAKMLGIEIVVNHVFINQNDTTKIAKIDQTIF